MIGQVIDANASVKRIQVCHVAVHVYESRTRGTIAVFVPKSNVDDIHALFVLMITQEFLLAEESEEDTEWNYDAKEAVVIKDADFTWERHPTREDEDGPPEKGAFGKQTKEKKDKRKSIQSAASIGSGSAPGSVRNNEARSRQTCHEVKRQNFQFDRALYHSHRTTESTDHLATSM